MDEIAGCTLLSLLSPDTETNSISEKVQGEEEQMEKPVR